MTRNEEYRALLRELETVPVSLETTVDKALTREKALQKKWRCFRRLTASAAACAAAFVLMVNLVPTFAYACGGVPLLRELAKAVAWSPSLSAAVEQQYVQPMGLAQTNNGVTATVEYLIVDQKQVNIFYTLEGDFDRIWTERADVLPDDNNAISYGGFQDPPGSLLDITVDYVDEDVPDGFTLTLAVAGERGSEMLGAPQQVWEDEMLRPSER